MMRWCLFLVVLMACGAPTFTYTTHVSYQVSPARYIPIAIDNAFTHEEVGKLKEAIEEWNRSLNGQMVLSVYTTDFNMQDNILYYITNARGILMLKVSRYGSVMFNLENENVAITSGIGMDAREIYFLREKTHIETIKSVALHELGHALGATHRSFGLMKHENDPAAHSCIDWETVKQVAEYNHLNPNTMNWCQ